MKDYGDSTYGDAFVDVYDEWYLGITDVDSSVSALADLAAHSGDAPIVELGVGTGRLAIPLAERVGPRTLWGIDTSEAMLAALAAKRHGLVRAVHGDMVDALQQIPGAIGLVFVAYNTFFNLGSAERQQRCFNAVASRLHDDGRFVIEAFVPDDPPRSGDHIEVKTLTADRVVLSVTRYDGDAHVAEGQFVELTERGGVRLRPWSIRYASPQELDAMAAHAGLRVSERWETFRGDPFTADSPSHVTVYALAEQSVK
ncbi:MAG TPA: class I SAM-dependent methyltransferase [Acidimicrobiia bacterium]|nr:class I SAM-dependent methyltransferase [Acidimicrobiia bacterium]